MNTPEPLIPDEPTKGFDPVNGRLLMDIIEDQQRAGATVVMVTHQIEEVQRPLSPGDPTQGRHLPRLRGGTGDGP